MEFVGFPKIGRLSKDCIITEKIDGTNAQICIGENGEFLIGSRTIWITPENDNHGFAKWCIEHKEELLKLGIGRHFGEWWGSGVNRGYGLTKGEKRFSLFNVSKWYDDSIRPSCCDVVPILYQGIFDTNKIQEILDNLKIFGSRVSPGYMNPEGIIIYHTARGHLFKKTIDNDNKPKTYKNGGVVL